MVFESKHKLNPATLPICFALLTALVAAHGFHTDTTPQGAFNIIVGKSCDAYQLANFTTIPTDSSPYGLNLTYDLTSQKQNLTTWDFQSYSLRPPNCFVITRNISASENRTVNGTHYPQLATDNATAFAQAQLVMTFKLRNNEDTYKYVIAVNATDNTKTPNESILDIMADIQSTGNQFGTIGFFEAPKQFVAVVQRTLVVSSQMLTNATVLTSCTSANSTGNATILNSEFNKDVYRFNCLINPNHTVTEASFLKFSEYNYLTVTHSFPFWLLVLAMLSFIIVTNFIDEDLPNPESLRTSIWMNFPLHTIHAAASSQIYPRRMRVALVYFVTVSVFWFNAILDYRYMNRAGKEDINLGMRLGLFAFLSAVFGLIWEFILGSVLALYYRTNRQFLLNWEQETDYDRRKPILENYEERNFQLTHIFYFIFLIVGLFFTITPIYFLYWITTDDQAWWLLQGTIGCLWKYLVFDLILMFVGWCSWGRWVTSLRGFEFDYESWLKWEVVQKLF